MRVETLWCALYASTIWLPMVKNGCSDDCGSWKIIAAATPRCLRISSGSSPTISWPPSTMEPDIRVLAGLCSPMMAMLDTLLPEPDSPTMASVRPRDSE